MSIEKITSNGDDYTIVPQKYKIKLRKNTGDDSLDYDDVDNNFEILRLTINSLMDENTALALRITNLENN